MTVRGGGPLRETMNRNKGTPQQDMPGMETFPRVDAEVCHDPRHSQSDYHPNDGHEDGVQRSKGRPVGAAACGCVLQGVVWHLLHKFE